MIKPFLKKHNSKPFGLKQKLLTIESLIFMLPFLSILYIFYNKKVVLEYSQVSIIALILILILAGLILIRQIFNNIITIAASLNSCKECDDQLMVIMKDTSELQSIVMSFNQLMGEFKKSTGELKRRTYELFAIKELTETVSKSLDIDQMLNFLLEKAMSVCKAQIGSVLFLDPETQKFRVVAYIGADGPQKNSYIKTLNPVLQKVVSDRQPLVVQNVETDTSVQKQNDHRYKTPSFISIPIIIKNNLMAILNLADKETLENFNDNDEQVLSIMIDEIGFAIENAMLHLNIKEHLQNLRKRSKELSHSNEKLQQEIIERRQTEIELHKYKQIISVVHDHLLFVDNSFVCQAVNEAFLKAYRKEPHEVVGHTLSEIIGQKLFDERLGDKLERCLMGEEAQTQFWLDLPGIGKRFMDIIYYPFMEDGSTVTGVVIDARDITDTKKLETQLIESQKMEAIGAIASGVAHNFNNLLMAIQGNVSLMLSETDSAHRNYNMLRNIEKQIESGSYITRQLLGYSKKGRDEIKVTDLNRMVKETSDTFGKTNKEIRVLLELADDLFGINAERGQIEQILLNLYLNSADAMPTGGSLYLKTMNVTHSEILNKPYHPQPGRYVYLQVADTGLGIDEENRKHIFEPFFSTKSSRGTGLGLASVYGIVKGHGGYIDVESEKNNGTIFNIYLPASNKKVEQTPEVSPQLMRGHETVLFVDDEEMVLEVISAMLKKLGYSVLEANNGYEAIKAYTKNKDIIDIVILDMIMPGMGGSEVFDKLKELNKNIKVLLSSGYSLDSPAKHIMERGCDGFIKKPFNFIALSQKIRTILEKKL